MFTSMPTTPLPSFLPVCKHGCCKMLDLVVVMRVQFRHACLLLLVKYQRAHLEEDFDALKGGYARFGQTSCGAAS